MRKLIYKAGKYLIVFLLGAMTYGFIGAADAVYRSRAAGNFGGEVFVLPLIAAFIWFGWELRGNFLHK